MNKKPVVSFMIVGAQKSGTTALAHFCSQHPELEMASPKEPHIFDAPDFDSNSIDVNYQSFFSDNAIGNNQAKYLGEATPIYIYLPEIPERLHSYNPNLKLIILLRHPVDRAVSHYCMERNRGNEARSFFVAVLLEPFRLWRDAKNRALNSSARTHSYMQRGDYPRQIDRLLQYFPKDQLISVDFEDLNNNHEECLARIFQFLGVDPGFKIGAEQVFSTSNRDVPKWIVGLLSLLFFKRIASYKRLVARA